MRLSIKQQEVFMREDLTGRIFGRLTVVSLNSSDSRGRKKWNCLCECGSNLIVRSDGLKSGHTKSCGCLRLERLRDSISTHGKSKTPEYKVWTRMRERCLNQKDKSYPNYGGRGIDISSEWGEFDRFISDMGKRPTSKHSLDRIDNNKGYSKDNCRWATKQQQVINRRKNKNNKSNVSGVSFYSQMEKWRSYITVDRKQIALGLFADWFDAICARKSAENKYHVPILES